MKIAVIGGLGFIGSHIVDVFIKNNHEVFVYDNLSTGDYDNRNEKAQYYTGDIINVSDLNAFFMRVKPTIVCHHAAQIDVQTSMKQPKFDANVNIMGTINLLDMCIKHRVKRIIYASSAAIYGNPEYLGIDEKHNLNPLSFYGLSKSIPEKYIKLYAANSNLTYGILRYANVYGPRQKSVGEGGVVAIFTKKMKKDEECYIFGDGKQTRDFIYVKDIANANLLASQKNINFTINISTNTEITINEVFEIIKECYSYKKSVNYKEKRDGDIINSYLDNNKANKLIGFSPTYSFKKGILEMSKYI